MRTPDKRGIAGRGWELPLVRKRIHQLACLAAWLVHAPESHIIWPYKLVGLIHLRPIVGVPSPTLHYAGAQFELTVVSINPERCPEPDPDLSNEGYPILRPVDVVEQFHGVDDATALQVCMGAIDSICAGQLIPDQDFRSHWHSDIQERVRRLRDARIAN